MYISEQEEKVIEVTLLRSAVSGSSSAVFGATPKEEIEEFEEEEHLEDIILVESPTLLQEAKEETSNVRKRNSCPSPQNAPSTSTKIKRAKENLTTEEILNIQSEKEL